MLHCCSHLLPSVFSMLLFPPFPLPTSPQKTNKNKTNKQIYETSFLEWFKSLYTVKTLSNDWLLSRCLCSLLNSSISEQLSPTLAVALSRSLFLSSSPSLSLSLSLPLSVPPLFFSPPSFSLNLPSACCSVGRGNAKLP